MTMTRTQSINKNRVLIVDDQPGMVETLADILKDRGCSVTLASDGYQAVKQVGEQSVDLVLMDVVMPGMNGLDTYRAIKYLRPQTPVVMMTGYKVDHLVKQAIHEGTLAVLQKPVDPATIVAIVLAVLRLAT
jgi:DNA-binding NtrC family response regulator